MPAGHETGSPATRPWLVALLAIAWCSTCMASAAAADVALGDEELDAVQVTGEHPGPAMWKLSKGDHTVWIMGTLAPMPAKMTWRSKQVEAVIRQSGEVVGNTSAEPRIKGGFFGAVRLIPAMVRAFRIPGELTLRQVLPRQVHARWSEQYRRFYGKDPKANERTRPLWLAEELYEQALRKSGLVDESPVWPTVEKLAKRHDVRIRERQIDVLLEDPKGLTEDLAQVPLDKETACLVVTMDYIDRELPNLKRRAQAWAVGDMATLRALPPAVDRESCDDEVLESMRAPFQKQVNEVDAEVESDVPGILSWMLLTHQTSFAVVPIGRLLASDDLIANWRAAGYTVEEPN